MELFPMLVVKQGQVAVIKAYVGLATADTSGEEFKFGALVRPGHRGIWREPLRTGKYPINPHVYQAEIVPTAIGQVAALRAGPVDRLVSHAATEPEEVPRPQPGSASPACATSA